MKLIVNRNLYLALLSIKDLGFFWFIIIIIIIIIITILLLLQVIPVKVNYNYFTLYKASSLNLKII